jgi:hypothetical protein
MANRKIAPIAGSPKARRTIPQDVKMCLIALALMKGQLRETRTAVKHYRDRIEAKMPGGSRLVRKPGLVAALIDENNERVAKRKVISVATAAD